MDQLKDRESLIATANKFTEFLNEMKDTYEKQEEKIADLQKKHEESQKNYLELKQKLEELEEAEKNSTKKIKKLEDDVKTLKTNNLSEANKENRTCGEGAAGV